MFNNASTITARLASWELKKLQEAGFKKVSKKAILETLKAHPRMEFQDAVSGQTFNIEEAKKRKATWLNVRYNNDRDVAVLELAKIKLTAPPSVPAARPFTVGAVLEHRNSQI